jgi:hypothetical protein
MKEMRIYVREGKDVPYHELHGYTEKPPKKKDEVTPPGREDQVIKLKKVKPRSRKGKLLNPYAVAWAQHNKHGEPDKLEVAPPGREDQVKRFLKIYKGNEKAAYAAAWASYKKSKVGSPQNEKLKGSKKRNKPSVKRGVKKIAKRVRG